MAHQSKKTMICTICGCEQAVILPRKVSASGRSAVSLLPCIRCITNTEHKEKSVYDIEKQQKVHTMKSLYSYTPKLACNQIHANRTPEIQNIFIKCTLDNGLFLLFRNAGEAADWILMNELTKTAARNTIMKNIKDVLKGRAQTTYGQKFSYVNLVLYGKYCESPVGYCRLKGCYISDSDLVEKGCSAKKCWNFAKKKEESSENPSEPASDKAD